MQITRFLRSLPRIKSSQLALSHQQFHDRYSHVHPGTKSAGEVIVRGRVTNKRRSGKSLAFYDVSSDGLKIQSVFKNIDPQVDNSLKELSKGDHIEVQGVPGRTCAGELSIFPTKVERLSHCMHKIPHAYDNKNKRRQNKHIDFMVNPEAATVIRVRSAIKAALCKFLTDRLFLEVETPILQSFASGAMARPFKTESLTGPLQLRISPELALKKAVVGGFDRVFEVGRCFRNEGVSRRHQPEFTTCEFYQAYAGLDDLIETTKQLLVNLETVAREIMPMDEIIFKDFQEIDFMSRLATELGCPVPTTQTALIKLFSDRKMPIPEDDSMANLYDILGATCLTKFTSERPTFLMNFPECMSPLAKSTNGIAHRFEFYVNGIELINAYEEENDPHLQRHKFLAAKPMGLLSSDLTQEEDEYCKVLEWGLPPTGGWGMGVDRLVMLLTDQKSIQEVLLSGGIQQQQQQ